MNEIRRVKNNTIEFSYGLYDNNEFIQHVLSDIDNNRLHLDEALYSLAERLGYLPYYKSLKDSQKNRILLRRWMKHLSVQKGIQLERKRYRNIQNVYINKGIFPRFDTIEYQGREINRNRFEMDMYDRAFQKRFDRNPIRTIRAITKDDMDLLNDFSGPEILAAIKQRMQWTRS